MNQQSAGLLAASIQGKATLIATCALLLSVVLSGCGAGTPPTVTVAAAASSPTALAIKADREKQSARKRDERNALKRANAAYQANRLVAPAGDNALEHALRAREVNANSAGATELLTDIMPLATTQVQSMIAEGQIDEAERVIALLYKAHPNSLTTLSLHRQIAGSGLASVHR